ncbi:MAG: ferritin-like domain-containing protein [Bryobacteraceae bacterium]
MDEIKMNVNEKSRKMLVDLLHQAAQIEHSLLVAYLYAACSLKSMPWEFAEAGASENRRRAIQFERTRAWKQSILTAAREEMRHVHYVQCLLRLMGEAPCFELPARDESGDWVIPDWRERIWEGSSEKEEGVAIRVAPLTPETVRQFVLFESGDWLQDANPFGPQVTALLDELYEFEADLHLETILYQVQDPARRAELKEQLNELQSKLTPLPGMDHAVAPAGADSVSMLDAAIDEPADNLPRFQSIVDLYLKGILPLFEEAFTHGWVQRTNAVLVTEFQTSTAGSIGAGPSPRNAAFSNVISENFSAPIENIKDVERIIYEIVTEGEGIANFENRARALLDQASKIGGTRSFLELIKGPASAQPPWFNDLQVLRSSHIYRFAMIMVELGRERRMAGPCGEEFRAWRQPIELDGHVELARFTADLPAQFNACYLVLIAWLSRMYEFQDWKQDERRRVAIESLATWPLMSTGIRPMLELTSFFPIDRQQLFRQDPGGLPALPVFARQLAELYTSGETTAQVKEHQDTLALRVLSSIGAWAEEQKRVIAGAGLPANSKDMIWTRINALSRLKEFQMQFDFRVGGGYSAHMPSLNYLREHQRGSAYEEDPSLPPAPGQPQQPLFAETLVLRLRFSGWQLIQLAMDFDPPGEEAGCTGTNLLHAADGDRKLDRALVWQEFAWDKTILREPRENLPAIGVNLVEASIMVTGASGARAGYTPLPAVQPAVLAPGSSRDLTLSGLYELDTLTASGIIGANRSIRLLLKSKDGVMPYLHGLNHVVWQDCEPIDPFILAVLADPPPQDTQAASPELLLQREVFNCDLSFLDMTPIQRLYSARWPCGGGNVSQIPDWVPVEEHEKVHNAATFVAGRVGALADALSRSFPAETQQQVDSAISFAERMPVLTTKWLGDLGHYGHTLSGNLTLGEGANPIVSTFAERTNLQTSVNSTSTRGSANGRWLVKYTLGAMDNDALSCLVFGELYIPLNLQVTSQPVHLENKWEFPASMETALAEYACQFEKPFWTTYQVNGTTRTLGTITETLETPSAAGSYTYTMTGIAGLTSFTGSFSVNAGDLVWSVSFVCENPQAAVQVLQFIGESNQQMTDRLNWFFSPG